MQYMRNGFLIYEKMQKYFPMYEEVVSHIWFCNCSILNFVKYEENFIFFFISEVVSDSGHRTHTRHVWLTDAGFRPPNPRVGCALDSFVQLYRGWSVQFIRAGNDHMRESLSKRGGGGQGGGMKGRWRKRWWSMVQVKDTPWVAKYRIWGQGLEVGWADHFRFPSKRGKYERKQLF